MGGAGHVSGPRRGGGGGLCAAPRPRLGGLGERSERWGRGFPGVVGSGFLFGVWRVGFPVRRGVLFSSSLLFVGVVG